MDFIPKNDDPPRIPCRHRKCLASFGRKTDARRHERQVHQPAKIFCKFSGCRFRGTVRAEVMRRHLKSKHPFDGKLFQSCPPKPFQLTTFKLRVFFNSATITSGDAYPKSRYLANLPPTIKLTLFRVGVHIFSRQLRQAIFTRGPSPPLKDTWIWAIMISWRISISQITQTR